MRTLEPEAISILFLSSSFFFFFFSSQIETIDDPVPAVEAILRRCNKHQVFKITLVYNEGHVRVLCISNFGEGCANKVSFTSFPCKGRIFHVN